MTQALKSKYPILDEIIIPDAIVSEWQITADLLAELTHVPAALIMRVHQREIEVFIRSQNQENVYKEGELAPLDTGLYCETVMDSQQLLKVSDALKDPNWDQNPDIELGMISYCGLPLTWPSGHYFGTICILDCQGNHYQEKQQAILERFRDTIQFDLANIYETHKKEQHSKQQFKELEAKYSNLIQSIPAVTYTAALDEDSTTLFVSPQIKHLIGFTPEEYKNNPDIWLQQLHPDDKERVLAQTRLVHQTHEALNCEYRMYDRQGNIKWVRDEANLVTDISGNPLCLQGVMYDISDLKNTEQALIKSEERFNLAMRGSNDGVFDWNFKSEEVYYSPRWKMMLGYRDEELENRFSTWESLVEPSDRKLCRTMMQDYMDGKRDDFNLEFKMRHKHGHWVDILSRAYLVRDREGNPIRVVGTHVDISEQKKAELAVRTGNSRYQSVISATHDGYWVADQDGNIIEVNQAYSKLSGYSRTELLSMTIADVEAQESPEDIKNHIKHIIKRKNALFETRHRKKNGEIWPVEASVSYSPIEGGRFFAFLRNIQDRKRQEQINELRQSLSEFVYQGDETKLVQFALDAGENLTKSQISFFHFINEDQENISLQVFSTRTINNMCQEQGQGMHNPLREAGVWVDCIHQRQAVIHNNYENLPHKKGLPEGHTKLTRELVVPIFDGDKIIAVIGVGNKITNYDHNDIDSLTQVAEITLDYLQRCHVNQQIEYMAYYDVLTGLPNRILLSDRLQQAIAQIQRSSHILAIAYLDLDGFKPINDRYGHHIGDVLLKTISNRVKEALRLGDTVARLGGDEFVILLTELSSFYESEEVIARILNIIKEPIEIDNHRLHVSASIGVTIYPTDLSDPDTLLRHADQAMYKAKAKGKSCFYFYDPVQDKNLSIHRKMLLDFENAIHKQQLQLYYQPKVDLRTGKVIGVEALVRWNHPEQGFLLPGKFLPLIEDTPLEIALGEWVVFNVLEQHAQWCKQGLDLKISVNISPRHLQLDGFSDFMTDVLSKFPEHTSQYLELEILETAAIGNISKVANTMQACSKRGIRFLLDDFGTGYSSLTYFQQLPVDILKIDQNFVKDILDQGDNLDIVEGVLRLAEKLQRPVIAEGVESIEIGMMLLQLGCHYAQGYGIARPMPAEQVKYWLREWQDNSFWHQLPKETNRNPENYDLNVAIFSHQRWLNSIINYINGKKSAPERPAEESECQFGRWSRGIGITRYGNHPSFSFIEPKHRIVHETATRLLKEYDCGDKSTALSRLPYLQKQGNDLIKLLKKLANK